MDLIYVTWNASPVIFSLGSLSVRWYGLFWALSFLIGFLILKRIFEKESVSMKELDSLFIHIVIGSIVGARLGHCFFYDFDYFIANPIEILFIWQGGLASHGAAIGIMVALLLYTKRVSSKSFFWTADRLLIVVALAAAFIRFGNIMNHEIYGHVTELPWGFKFITNISAWMNGADPIHTDPRHPTGLYEALGYLMVFGSMLWLYFKKINKLYQGFMASYFLITLFSVRFVVEFWKEVQSPFEEGMLLNMGQLLSIPLIIAGFVILFITYRQKLPALAPPSNSK